MIEARGEAGGLLIGLRSGWKLGLGWKFRSGWKPEQPDGRWLPLKLLAMLPVVMLPPAVLLFTELLLYTVGAVVALWMVPSPRISQSAETAGKENRIRRMVSIVTFASPFIWREMRTLSVSFSARLDMEHFLMCKRCRMRSFSKICSVANILIYDF